ncbi:Uncharacterised protein, partial [Mycoplasma putrefaciens]
MLLNQKVKNNTNFKSPKQRSGFVFNLLRSLIW